MASAQGDPLLQFVRRLTAADAAGDAPDRALLARFVARHDQAAFAALVRRHGPLVLAACRRVLGDGPDVDDAFQVTFVVLARKARSLRQPELLGNYLYGVAFRTASKAKADAARRRAREGRATAPAFTAPAEDVERRDLRRVLDEEVDRLPARYRTPVVLCYLEGQTQEQAARLLGCPRKTVTTRLTRACARLRSRLLRRGVALSAAGAALFTGETASAAVPPALVDATVKAAACRGACAAASARVITLTQGVLRAMFLTKLKTVGTALVLAAAIFLGTGLAVRATLATTPEDGSKGAGTSSRKAAAVTAAEKKELAEFHKIYALPPGVDLKRVGPPFPACRLVYYRHTFPHREDQPVSQAMYFHWQDGGNLKWWGMNVGGKGATLRDLPRMLAEIYLQQIEGPADLLDTVVEGDFVVRAGIGPARFVSALDKLLRQECKLPVKLALRQVERKVIVAHGKYRFRPVAGRAGNQVEIYGATLGDPARGGGGSGDFPEMLQWVGMFIGRQVVSEAQDTPKGRLSWHYNERSPFTAEERAADHDEQAVLKHLAEQTGLTFREETRRVPMLFVERSE
jgi:RNA polymerase sigma factor (sigma-70 family)